MDFLVTALSLEKPSDFLRTNKQKLFAIIPELSLSENFEQNNKWHIYDVFEHVLHVVDEVPNDFILRMSALFHDIGKPYVYQEDENGIGHFFGHWDKSNEIFLNFVQKYNLQEQDIRMISNLILYHDLNFLNCTNEEVDNLLSIFGDLGIEMLFQLKRSDLLAQSEEFHYMLKIMEEQKLDILKRKNIMNKYNYN